MSFGICRLAGYKACRGLLLAFAIASFTALASSSARAASESNPPQRAVLYDEDPSNPKGNQFAGTVVWRTESVKIADQPEVTVVSADVDVPSRKFKMTFSLRRNTDSTLPASHIAELKFDLPPDFVGGGVGNVPGILMKSNEQSRGTPFAALAVKVKDGFFMVGLSNVDVDRARNLELLLNRAWFDIPLVYSNGRRAIIAIEKGRSGADALAAAFGTERQSTSPEAASSGRRYAVQVAAHNDEAAALAAYQLLRTKFPAVFGSREATVKRVDSVGGGLFLAMVGPFSTADEAFDMCDRLRAAGGECIVERN